MLGNIVGQRPGDGVLQEPFIRDQAVPIDVFHLDRVKIYRHNADERKNAQDDVEDGNPSWKVPYAQSGPLYRHATGGVLQILLANLGVRMRMGETNDYESTDQN